MRRGALLLLVLALGLAGCGGDDADDAAREAERAAREAERASESVETVIEDEVETVVDEADDYLSGGDDRCQAATTDIMTPISNKLTVRGGRLRNGYYVKSDVGGAVYIVSAEIDGAGLEGDGDVATWVTESPGGAGAIYALDDLARKHSGYRDAREEANVSMDTDGVAESRDCAGG